MRGWEVSGRKRLSSINQPPWPTLSPKWGNPSPFGRRVSKKRLGRNMPPQFHVLGGCLSLPCALWGAPITSHRICALQEYFFDNFFMISVSWAKTWSCAPLKKLLHNFWGGGWNFIKIVTINWQIGIYVVRHSLFNPTKKLNWEHLLIWMKQCNGERELHEVSCSSEAKWIKQLLATPLHRVLPIGIHAQLYKWNI